MSEPCRIKKHAPIGPLTLAPGWHACFREDDGTISKEQIVGFALTKTTIKVCELRDKRVVVLDEWVESHSFMGYVASDVGVEAAENMSNFVGYAYPEDDDQ